MSDSPRQRPALLLVLTGFVLAAALARLLPHPPNFSPIEAMALFGGAYFAHRSWALLVPLLAMVLSDIGLALLHGGAYSNYFGSGGFWLVYACIAGITVLGFALRGRVSALRVMGFGLVGSLTFFAVTNFGVWWGSAFYPQNLQGLIACYVAGLPFLHWTVLGTVFYSALLFGGYELLQRRVPGLRSQFAA